MKIMAILKVINYRLTNKNRKLISFVMKFILHLKVALKNIKIWN